MILERVRIDLWDGGVNILRNEPIDQTFAYHGYNDGSVRIRDTRTGELLKKIPTPFHDGIEHHDPLQIRNFSDITICGVDSEWILAVTVDGTLHSIDVEHGRHRREWTEKSSHPEIIGVRGTAKILLEGIGGKSLFDVPLRVWDQSTRTQQTIEKMPYGGWRAAWGNLAWNHFNSRATLWNYENAKELKLQEGESPISDIIGDTDNTRVFALHYDGSVDVFAVDEGIRLLPLGRLVCPVDEQLEASITLGDNGRRLFWLGRSRDSDEGGKQLKKEESVIALFDLNGLRD